MGYLRLDTPPYSGHHSKCQEASCHERGREAVARHIRGKLRHLPARHKGHLSSFENHLAGETEPNTLACRIPSRSPRHRDREKAGELIWQIG